MNNIWQKEFTGIPVLLLLVFAIVVGVLMIAAIFAINSIIIFMSLMIGGVVWVTAAIQGLISGQWPSWVRRR